MRHAGKKTNSALPVALLQLSVVIGPFDRMQVASNSVFFAFGYPCIIFLTEIAPRPE
jgi:hypothetical protein